MTKAKIDCKKVVLLIFISVSDIEKLFTKTFRIPVLEKHFVIYLTHLLQIFLIFVFFFAEKIKNGDGSGASRSIGISLFCLILGVILSKLWSCYFYGKRLTRFDIEF